jgi:hypothetical protein
MNGWLGYPVAKMMTSAGSSLSSSNLIPPEEISLIKLSLFSFNLPSMMYWLPPTSAINPISMFGADIRSMPFTYVVASCFIEDREHKPGVFPAVVDFEAFRLQTIKSRPVE